jgi:uncharacterized repeat protein (TIGR01451 family)
VQGLPTPTGTVDFYLCQPATVSSNGGDCSSGGAKVSTGTLDSAGKASSDATSDTTAIGTYCWRAEYSGDSNYNGSSHTNSTSECFTTVKQPSSTDTTSSPTGGNVAPGSSVSDQATVSGGQGQPVPTGTVDFYLCQPATVTSNGGDCSAGGAKVSTGSLDSAGKASSDASTDTTAVGTYCWRAEYSGDGFYNGSAHTNSGSECFTVAKQPSSTDTSSSPSGGNVVPGTSVSDQATVSGGQGQPVPTGTVDFFLCQPATVTANGGDCSAGGAKVSTGTLDSAGKTSSAAASNTTAIGTYCWRAEYSGDGFYNGSSHTNNGSECFTVVKQPSSTDTTSSPTGANVVPGTSVSDQATVSGGQGQPVPSGTVDFYLCQPDQVTANGCESGGTKVNTASLDSTGKASSAASSDTTAIGTYCWRAEYSGDDFYLPSTHTNNSSECFSTGKLTPTVATVIHAGPGAGDTAGAAAISLALSGSTVHDLARVSGAAGTPTGTVSFTVFLGNTSCGGDGAAAGTVALAGGVAHPSADATVPAGGLSYRAHYNGDGVYTATDGPCEALPAITPSISITKNPKDKVVRDGDTVTFTIVVTNTGDADLSDVTVSDPLTGSCAKAIGPLAKGASTSYPCTTDALHSSFTNVATVVGTPPLGPKVTASDSAPVTVIHPAIAIVKSPDGQSVNSGDTFTFTITVTNTGDVDLSDVLVTDPLTPSCDNTLGSLLQGASTSYTCTTAALTASFTNLASVSGTPPVGPPVTASDTAPVTVVTPPPPAAPTHPSISVSKLPASQTVTTGLTATFTIAVTNTGDVTLTNVNVGDALSPGCARTSADIPALATMTPGQTVTYQCTSPAVTASFTNVAVATGTPPSGPNVTASASADVTAVAPLQPPPKKKPKVVSHKKPKATG